MIGLQNKREVVMLEPTALTNGATGTSRTLDCLNADEVNIVLQGSTSDNATNNPSVLKIQESDTTDATNFADITALVGDGAGGFTIPDSPTATTDDPFAVFNITRRGNRKRYLRLLVSPVTTQTFFAVAKLSLNEAANSATEQNAAVVATV